MPPVSIRREGWPFIAVSAVITLALFGAAQSLGWIGIIVTGWCVCFFRDPERVVPTGDGLVISPADGVVQMITDAPPPPELEMGDAPLRRISVFMNVFNCHVNRAPVGGAVTRASYRPGAFVNASLDKASERNERRALCIEMPDGRSIAVVQIAGLVARRILCWADKGDDLRAGERFGMIRFGSRLDVYLPQGTRILVANGQQTIAGETIIAELGSNEPDREGEVR
ncbi:MAG: phosphatidylserine decarboxylase [Alphaproteobacteria bacterium]